MGRGRILGGRQVFGMLGPAPSSFWKKKEKKKNGRHRMFRKKCNFRKKNTFCVYVRFYSPGLSRGAFGKLSLFLNPILVCKLPKQLNEGGNEYFLTI